VRHLLPRLARKAGITRRVHAHGLRHTYAAELARERTPINVIRDALGHSTLRGHRSLPVRRRPGARDRDDVSAPLEWGVSVRPTMGGLAE
jgi:integrase